jgi:hypothetical protein
MTDTAIRATHSGQSSIATSGTSNTLTLPSGLTAGDPLRIFVASNSTAANSVPTAPTGWSLAKAVTAMGTASFFILERTGGWQTGDGTSLTIDVTAAPSAINWAYVAVGLDQDHASGWDTAGTYTVKASSSNNTTAAGAGSAGDDMMVAFFGKMTGNNGTPTVTPDAVLIDQFEPTDAASPNVWIGSYTPGTAETQTIIYAASTANGAGVQIPLVAATPPSGPTLRGVIQDGAEITGVALRGVIQAGAEVPGVTLREVV